MVFALVDPSGRDGCAGFYMNIVVMVRKEMLIKILLPKMLSKWWSEKNPLTHISGAKVIFLMKFQMYILIFLFLILEYYCTQAQQQYK